MNQKQAAPFLKRPPWHHRLRALALTAATLLGTMPIALAAGSTPATTNMWERFSELMQDIYGQIVGISTIVAVTMAVVALIVRMVSRNQRAVDEATTWLKRIVITWVVLNSLGFFVAYVQPLITGGNYTP